MVRFLRFLLILFFMPLAAIQWVNPNLGEWVQAGANIVRRKVFVIVTVKDGVFRVDISVPPHLDGIQAEITAGGWADLLIPTFTSTMTLDAIQKAGEMTGTLVINPQPNSAVAGGYQIAFPVLSQFRVFDPMSIYYAQFQSLPFTANQTMNLFHTITVGGSNVDQWFESPGLNAGAPCTGLNLAPTWSSDQLLLVPSGAKSSVTLTFHYPYAILKDLPNATYSFTSIIEMNPYAIPNTAKLKATQTTFLNSYIGQINGTLKDKNSVNQLTTKQIANLNASLLYLQAQLKAVNA